MHREAIPADHTRILLVRHGETEWNAIGRIQGHLAVPLNKRGLAQAEAVARRLGSKRFHALYSSDLTRARQTAEAIARHSGHALRPDKRLREWDLGILCGLQRAEARRDRPEIWAILRDRQVDREIPGGESIRQRSGRMTAAVQEIAHRHRGETVVLVSHGGPIGDCYRRATGAPLEDPTHVDLYNAAVNAIRIRGESWSIEYWADVDHLADIGSLANWEGSRSSDPPPS